MISVAAELAEMHPQTLRMYEARGLITPEALAEEHPPLLPRGRRAAAPDPADDRRGGPQPRRGRDRARSSSASSSGCAREMARMRERAAELERQMDEEVERVRRSLRAEIVPYGAYEAASGRRPEAERRHDPDRAPRATGAPPR